MKLAPSGILLSASAVSAARLGHQARVLQHDPSSVGENPIERCTPKHIGNVKGFIFDLDGTMYNKDGLLPGVQSLFTWLDKTSTPYIMASNGIRRKEGVANKFANGKFKLDQKIDPENVYTAAVSMSKYMTENVPKGAYVYALGTTMKYADGKHDFITDILKQYVPEDLYNSWTMRTDMTDEEINTWANEARNEQKPVFVLLAVDSNPRDELGADPVTNRPDAYNGMDFQLIAKVNTLLRNGGHLLVASPDVAHSMPKHPKFNIDTSHPTMGGWEMLFLQNSEMFPGTQREVTMHANTGKGGNQGAHYFMTPTIELLKKRVPGIKEDEIIIVGDNFGTDIKAGNDAHIKSILVLVGAHQLADATNWPSRPSCYLPNVGEIPNAVTGDAETTSAASTAKVEAAGTPETEETTVPADLPEVSGAAAAAAA